MTSKDGAIGETLYTLLHSQPFGLIPVTEERGTVLIGFKCYPNQKPQHALRTEGNKFRKTEITCENKYLLHVCENIQLSTDDRIVQGAYNICPTQIKMFPLKSAMGKTISDKGRQMERGGGREILGVGGG